MKAKREIPPMEENHRILFEKPDLEALTRLYTVVDLHFHSDYSDGMNSVNAVAERAAELGIGIALTDHNQIHGAVEIDSIEGVFSIPGIEVTSREGTHVLVYFYDVGELIRFYENDVEPFRGKHPMSSIALDLQSVVERARSYEALVIFPHPYSAVYTGVQNVGYSDAQRQLLLDRADGVEVLNASNLTKWNLRGALLGFNMRKCITGGSDGHRLEHMGLAVTYADCRKNRRDFLDAVRNRECRVVGKEIDIFRKMSANSSKLKTNFRNYPDIVEKNLRYSYLYLNSKSKNVRESVRKSLNGGIWRYRTGNRNDE